MAKLGDPTDFSYRIDKVIKVVDGDTIDVMIDLGFDIKYKSRVRSVSYTHLTLPTSRSV